MARELERQKQQNKALRRRLRAARMACAWWLAKTGATLSKTGGVPRGEWGFELGANTAAAHIAAVLGSGE